MVLFFKNLTFGLILLWAILVSCSTNEAILSRYEAEKKFQKIEKFIKDSQIKPELNKPDLMNQLKNSYRELSDYCLNSLDKIDSMADSREFGEIRNIAYVSTKQISQILFADKKYDSCINLIYEMMNRINLRNYQRMFAFISIGQALQASGNWDSAIVIYNYSIKNFYPPVMADSGIAYDLFNLPLHVFNIYQQTNDTLNAKKYFADAEQYYQTLIDNFPETEFYFASRSNLARLYYNDQKWTKAIDQLSGLIDTTGFINPSANMKIADIYAVQLRQFDTALKTYEYINNHLSDRDTLWKPVILFKKSLVYLEKADYQKTRSTLIELANRYPAYFEYYPTPQYTKARSFELEGNWDRAETEYKFLIENYPGSQEAMSTHLYLAKKLDERGRSKEADLWRQKAETYFNEIARQNRGTVREAMALSYQAELFREQKKWQASAETMTEIFDKFPDSEIGQHALLTASEIYRQKLNNPLLADSLITRLRTSLTKAKEEWGS